MFPANPEYCTVGQDVARWVLDALDVDGQVSAPKKQKGRAGFFRVERGQQDLFVKVVRAAESETQMLAASIQMQIMALSDLAPRLLSIIEQNEHLLVISEMLQVRVLASHDDCFHNLGMQLRQLHNVLKFCTDTQAVSQRSQDRLRMLSEASRLRGIQSTLRTKVVEALRAIDDKRDFWNVAELGAQVVHGDLNPGNILIGKKSDPVRFTDFEDATVSFFPVCYDLSYVLLRVIFPATSNGHEYRYAADFLDGYCSQDSLPKPPLDDLVWWMWWICLRNDCLLDKLEQEGGISDQALRSERGKISFLVEHMDNYVAKLREISED